ncbi:hypothetical protein [Dyella caseinilytica]|uniref:Uncharacterized protein n=1 Tax=Dyella caseinilytica TaxID=1849581 RepID=A0ABX7GYM5_9GAMM|nr:hypothetical protein [Dyella caseinilytica]QRN55394.1 hypothetical protein ISN74_08760 [Dyella caseinilytica]GGA01380.1 hypothetical protein GCM10011408_23340 [Dyella caseinilytica]
MANEANSRGNLQPADHLFCLVFQHWDEEGDDARVFDASSGNTTSARDRHLANTEREIFNLFVDGGHSEAYASAMLDFMRRPCTQQGDWTLVKGGVPITAYMDELTQKGL